MRITYLTAGAAGMYCGSCMHDNAIAKALLQRGHDVQLLPLYTPIRTDEEDVSIDEVFFGGINVYLQQRSALFRWLPRWATSWLDRPSIIRWATTRGIKTTAKDLGALSVSMLRGEQGFQAAEVERLAAWLADQPKPDVLHLTNILIGGVVPAIRKRFDAKVHVTLQGDDIFLDELPEPWRSQTLAEIKRLIPYFDGFLANSRFYADYMADYLGAPREKFKLVPLGLDLADFQEFSPARVSFDDLVAARSTGDRPPTIGYLARLAPEKGLHVLVDAFIKLKRHPGHAATRLRIAGWLGEHRRAYAEEQFNKLKLAGLSDHFDHVGEVDRKGKLAFLRSIDVVSVPTTYREPKGLFVLEALAAGVPVVEPDHGAFPELLQSTGGGLLFPPEDSNALAERLDQMLTDPNTRRTLAETGWRNVHTHHGSEGMAAAFLAGVG